MLSIQVLSTDWSSQPRVPAAGVKRKGSTAVRLTTAASITTNALPLRLQLPHSSPIAAAAAAAYSTLARAITTPTAGTQTTQAIATHPQPAPTAGPRATGAIAASPQSAATQYLAATSVSTAALALTPVSIAAATALALTPTAVPS